MTNIPSGSTQHDVSSARRLRSNASSPMSCQHLRSRAHAALPVLHHGEFADGEARFESIDPTTGRAWAEMPEAREADVDRAVEAARIALHDQHGPH